MIEQNYRGYILAAHPKREEPVLRRGTILVIDHDSAGAIGLQLNKPYTNSISFNTVMQNVGLSVENDQPLYNGGSESTNRIHIVHTMDWTSPTTNKITDHIGISSDISVLAAIHQKTGPNHYRAIAGFTRWLPGHLEGEILGEDPWTINHSWSFVSAAPEIVFGYTDVDQWHKVIVDSSRQQVASWF
jgi:putative transcriptional regulator